MSEPVKAIVWQNGMLMVFDANGQQVPKYQGEARDNIKKLLTDFPNCEVIGGVWR